MSEEIIVFFGAGASYGSEISVRVPPLGPKLFDELVTFTPNTWGGLSGGWSNQFRSNFETAMASFIKSGGFGAPLQWDMAEYFYSQFRATSSSLYVSLLNALTPNINKILFVTINYEGLLFQARGFTNITLSSFKVCMPHGNSCLCCEGPRGQRIQFTGGISTGGKVRVFQGITDFKKEKSSNVFPPVMSYYEPNKFTVSCANFIQKERKRYNGAVQSARKIAIVGVKINSIDTHIWQPLSKSPAKLLYLSGSSAATEFSTWSKGAGRSGDQIVSKYFKEGLSELINFLT